MTSEASFTEQQQSYLPGFVMGADVARAVRGLPVLADSALCDIVAQHGGMAPEEAKAYVVELSRSKRYHRDVY